MRFLSILFLGAMSVPAFAQQQSNNVLFKKNALLKPQTQKILARQMATHGLNKTTGNKQRLVGYSAQYPQSGYVDSSYLGYSGLRGSSFANCLENMEGPAGAFSKPDTIWRFSGGALSTDIRYTYDAKDSVLSTWDAISHYQYVYTLDNAGNTIVTNYYDTISNPPTQMASYSLYDNQNRKIFDSTENYSKTIYSYGAGFDSAVSFSWDNGLMSWYPADKIINTYNNAGLLVSNLELTAAPGGGWDSSSRNTYTYNNNGLLMQSLYEMYYQGPNVWENGYREKFDYTGNYPLHSSYQADIYDQSLGWTGDTKYSCQTNSAGNWDTAYLFGWDHSINDWVFTDRIDITYNSFDYITKMQFHAYDGGTASFDPNPYELDRYYYKTYMVPDAVKTVNTASAEITAYPNPVSGKLHIDGNIGSKDVSVQLISITGVRLFHSSGNWQSMNKEIDMSAFASGVYYLLVADNDGNKIATKQIVKG